MSDEIWIPIPTHTPYEASSMGRIRRDGRVIKPFPCARGYLYFKYSFQGARKNVAVHRCVALAFHIRTGPEVRHKNGNNTDNKPDNLAWCTHIENERDKIGHGTLVHGEKSHLSKLTTDQVQTIRNSLLPQEELATMFNVHRTTVNRVKNGTVWRSV